MKFMKLGSKLDAFQSDGSDIRFVVSELPTDVVVSIGEIKFYLHKFPLVSKTNRLRNLVFNASEESCDEIYLQDFPGGPKAFEICAKFCYGMTVTLNAYNVVAARCAAEYLQMTEDVEKGNLIHKIEVFLNSSVLRSWKDSIIVLQTAKSLLPWSEELKVVGRCIDCIASKTSADPATISWTYTYNRELTVSNETVEAPKQMNTVPSDWWVEDLCELDVDLYKRVMISVKSKGRMSSDIIVEALKAYAIRWLPNSYDGLVEDDYMKRNRVLVETIISLLPSDKCSGCSCRFLLKLLKVVILIGAGHTLKDELIDRISVQLHKASVKDLLISAKSSGDTMYNVDLLLTLVNKFIMRIGRGHDMNFVEEKDDGFVEINPVKENLLALGRLVDGYLSEVASDPYLSVSSFTDIAKSVPDASRPTHDALYTSIDIYLKEHPKLTKVEKKRLCGLMDVKKLSTEASIHAAQNERLPLRVVVQVLFFEQLKPTSVSNSIKDTSNCSEVSLVAFDADWEGRASEHHSSLKQQLGCLKIKVDECRNCDEKRSRSAKEQGSSLLLPSRSRRIFNKLWAGKGQGETIKSSETSGSSQSPPPTSVNPGEANFSGCAKHMRYSIS